MSPHDPRIHFGTAKAAQTPIRRELFHNIRNSVKIQKKILTLENFEKISEDHLLESLPKLKNLQKEQINEFNSLLSESQDWKVIKTYRQCSLEIKKKEDKLTGVPILLSTFILAGIQPKDVFELLDAQFESKFL